MAQTSDGSPESREIRAFLSSTFRDFTEERELLAKQVFPELNRRARERGLELVEVDLRWGVTHLGAVAEQPAPEVHIPVPSRRKL
jgi:hypothetical protein